MSCPPSSAGVRKRTEAARTESQKEAELTKQREGRDKAVTKVQAEVEKAKRDHDKRASTIEAQRAALEERSEAEDARWGKQKANLELALRRDGDSRRYGPAVPT